MSLAIVINSCDKYSFVWDKWWYYFNKNWNYDYPVYFLNEKKDISFPVKQIKVDISDINLWTKKLRESVIQIPENNIFLLLEDLFITSRFKGFEDIYKMFKTLNADSLRIRRIPEKYTINTDTSFRINGSIVKKLDQKSKYLIAYSPNIFKKSFLLKCLEIDESPWSSEVKGSKRLEGKGYNIYSYLKPNWFTDVCRKGKITPEGEKLLKNVR